MVMLQHQPLRYGGQYADSETGLHYKLFGYYDPQIGWFTVQDPIGLSGGLHLYIYAPNPLKYIDAPGLCKTGTEDKNPYGTYRPDRPLPRDKNGRPVHDVDAPHTQHEYIPNPTGGTPQHGPAKDLEMP